MMNYLRYIEHTEETLQFYIWYQGYVRKFDMLSDAEKALSPPWEPKIAVKMPCGDKPVSSHSSAPSKSATVSEVSLRDEKGITVSFQISSGEIKLEPCTY